MADPLANLIFGLPCCVAMLLGFATGIEAVAQQRSNATLSEYQPHRITTNLRYLQQTLEQPVRFVLRPLILALRCREGEAMRAVIAISVVPWRVVGSRTMRIVLVHVSPRFGFDTTGPAGAMAALLMFAGIDVWLVWAPYAVCNPAQRWRLPSNLQLQNANSQRSCATTPCARILTLPQSVVTTGSDSEPSAQRELCQWGAYNESPACLERPLWFASGFAGNGPRR
jgi:hypothetical protein